jgi:hypothetical protein
MRKDQLKVGGHYTAEHKGRPVTVRLDDVVHLGARTGYTATILPNGPQVTWGNAGKFVKEVSAPVAQDPRVAGAVVITGTGTPDSASVPPAAPAAESNPSPDCDGNGHDGTTTITPEDTAELLDPVATADRLRLEERGARRAVVEAFAKDILDGGPYPAPKDGAAAHIWEAISRQQPTPPHIIVRALAGTGKTFTEIVGVGYALAPPAVWVQIQQRMGFVVQPSPEQQVVWDALAQSRGVRTVTYCAFNKSIVTEFGEKWGWLTELLRAAGVTLQFATVNSLGNSVVRSAFGYCKVADWHTENLLGELLGHDTRELKRNEPVFVKACCELVSLCKLTLAGWDEGHGFDPAAVTHDVLDEITNHYDIELDGNRTKVYDTVPRLLEKSLDVSATREIDYNDQNWLPVVLNLPVPKVDVVLADEVQDLPRVRQEFLRKMGRRLVMVGDVNQAIYGFAGADTDSIPRLERLLGGAAGPLQPLGLTETRRCGKAIVAEAQKVVPSFRAHELNGAGEVRHVSLEQYAAHAKDGDMCLCRVNAPLISQALRLIKAGRKAVVRGRDFGGQLIAFVDRLKANDPADLVGKADDWLRAETAKENRKRNPSEARLIALEDKYQCIVAFCDGAFTVQNVKDKMLQVFAGKECPKCRKHYNEGTDECYGCKVKLVQPKGVVFSSIHRAKGLEADNVFFLMPKGAECPHPMAKSAWQRQQELNCLYIGITRARNVLTYVR